MITFYIILPTATVTGNGTHPRDLYDVLQNIRTGFNVPSGKNNITLVRPAYQAPGKVMTNDPFDPFLLVTSASLLVTRACGITTSS